MTDTEATGDGVGARVREMVERAIQRGVKGFQYATSGPAKVVRRLTVAPPFASATQMSVLFARSTSSCPRLLTNAIRFPSGLHATSPSSNAGPELSRSAFFVATS